MTRDDLDRRLDAVDWAAAETNTPCRTGPIAVQSDLWCASLSNALRATRRTLNDGLRDRDIEVRVGAAQATTPLARRDAAGRGEPPMDADALSG